MTAKYCAAPASAGTRRCVYLINQISGHGHLDMYGRLYSKCLLENGYDVVLISQHDPGVADWLRKHDPSLADRFHLFTREELSGRYPPQQSDLDHGTSALERMLSRLPRAIHAHARKLHRLALRITLRAAALPRHVADAARRLRADGVDFVRDLLRHEARPLPFGVQFAHLADEIRDAAVKSGKPPDLVLFLYLDMMSQEPASCAAIEDLGVPWAGIRFHPDGSYRGDAFRPERFWLCRNARGAIFLNPQPIPAYLRKLPHLHFVEFPDVTDTNTLPAPSEFVQLVEARAKGRQVVLQLGTLSPHKGIFDLIALIRRADPSQFFFVIAGEVFWGNYGEREAELREFLENPPENCVVRLGYLEDERELNSLIVAADILYAVYRGDFYNSSNTMTKAAMFERPILVSDKFMMGERVRAYRIGETVRGGDIEDALFWLEEIAARPRSRFGFAAFRRDHSIETLNAALPAAVVRWLQEPSGART